MARLFGIQEVYTKIINIPEALLMLELGEVKQLLSAKI